MNLRWIVLIMMILGSCSNESNNAYNEMPADFDFSLKYGVYGKEEINTFQDFIVKDLVEDGTVQASLILNEQDMNDIYNEMMTLNIMDELELKKEEGCDSEPPSMRVWDIHMNGETKKFNYQSYCETPPDVLKLYQLEEFIRKIIIQKEEYKKLPAVNGSYE